MPFTFAHPAAVLVLRRFCGVCSGPLVWSALVIGTLAPDLEYFVRLAPDGRLTGAMPLGLLWDLVGGVVLFAVFHGLIKRPVVLLLPGRHRRALWPVAVRATRVSGMRGLAIGVSLLIGAGTHRLWDSFTHGAGWIVMHVRALQRLVFEVGGYRVTTFKILQHGSTVCGFVALGLGYYFWLGRQSSEQVSGVPVPVPVLRPWIRICAVAAICVSALGVGVVNVLRVSSEPSVGARAFVYFGIGAMAGGLVALLTVGLSLRLLGDRISLTNGLVWLVWFVGFGLAGCAPGGGGPAGPSKRGDPGMQRPRDVRLPRVQRLVPLAKARSCRFVRVAITSSKPPLVVAVDRLNRAHYWLRGNGRPYALLNDYPPCRRASCRSALSATGRFHVEASAFDPTGNTGDPGSYLTVLELSTLAEQRWDTWLQVHALALAPGEQRLVVVGQSFTPGLQGCPEGAFCVEQWDLRALRPLQKRFKNRFIRHHKLRTALYSAASSMPLVGQPKRQILPNKNYARIEAMAVGPGGRTLALSDTAGTVRIWDLDSKRLTRSLVIGGRHKVITALGFLGRHTLVLGSRTGWVAGYDLLSGKRRWSRTLKGGLTALALNLPSKRLAVATGRGVVELLNADNGRLLLRGHHHRGRVADVSFSSDGMQLVSVDSVCRAVLWQLSPLPYPE